MPSYPSHLVQRRKLNDGAEFTIRPIRAEDAAIEQDFVRSLSDETRYFRFMDNVRELSPKMLSHFTQVDYDRHLALIAIAERDGREIQVGVARYIADEGRRSCEFAIAIADDWQHRGLGMHLMRSLLAAARGAGIRTMYGDVLSGNHRMLRFVAKLGFRERFAEGDPRTMRVEIDL